MYRNYIKRLLDIICSLLGLIILSPLLLVVIVVMSFANKGAGVFFSQARPGRGERLFNMYKFKSMTDERDATGNLLPDSERLTAMGRFIRKTSIDELPQLWNVLRGDMSLVGPRPFLAEYLQLMKPHQRRRYEVRPGITGLAQINGRNKLSYQHRFKYDVWYVDNLSFALDVKIILETIALTLRMKDVSSATGETSEIFTGEN
ncbi:sugar transferase [uncultured Porphyromonas sp.]|jgi:lipopolysaccharide/colanic/teichoic acid biosynthesis glycosyltransferase|uniref:sugar transferase n=1 Tax=uncultured Porphyromonas sp. TaxID=159274 RepID=UPI00260C1DBF|nr:sugar transferase [uncultured Porphyromonas sp.]